MCDVVVVGSGAAGLAAAARAACGGADVLVFEKSDRLGGTTAVSGGVIWAPCNRRMNESGLVDSEEEALAYLQRLCAGSAPDDDLLETFVTSAGEAVAWLEGHTPLRLSMVRSFPDYYLAYDVPGKRVAGRALEPEPLPFGEALPEWTRCVAPTTTMAGLGARTTMSEDVEPGCRPSPSQLDEREAGDVRTKGPALVGWLLRGLLHRGIAPELGTAVRELVIEDGRVTGVKLENHRGTESIRARKGVVLACGGFEWDPDLVRTFIGYDLYPMSPPNNVGDGLRMALQAGALLGNMTSYWGVGVMIDPTVTRDGAVVAQFDTARGAPGSIIVNPAGRRFVNESAPYNDFAKSFGLFDASTASFPNRGTAWMIFDEGVRRRHQILSIVPGEALPGWVPCEPTVGRLARRIGLPGATLSATVRRYNRFATRNFDPDFHGHELGLIAPSRLRPLDRPPFYAVSVHPGTLGTNGGPRINQDGRVIDASGRPIPGLYAAGNTAAGVFGWAYPAGGATLGAAITFGVRAGAHLSRQDRNDHFP